MSGYRVHKAALRRLARVRAGRGLWSIARTWAQIFAAFALYLLFPSIATVLVALVVVSAAQMALAVLMHEGAHNLLARDRRVNDRIAHWLCGGPVLLDVVSYRAIHLRHHRHTWTADDPDLSLADHYPVSRASFRRKIARDLLGITGMARLIGLVRLHAGLDPYARGRQGRSVAQLARAFLRSQIPFLATNALLLGAFAAAGRPEGYLLLWWLPWLTGFSLVLRLRNIAEHALVADPADPLRQTRTTLGPAWLVWLVAPHHANFHIEHHLFQFVPHYHLPELHRLLADDGHLAAAEVEPSYLAVWRRAQRGPERARSAARRFIARPSPPRS